MTAPVKSFLKIGRYAGLALFCIASARGQGINTLENTSLYMVNSGDRYWGSGPVRVDSVWLGAAFLRDTTKIFRVWAAPSDAGWTGELYLFVPHGAANGGDTSIYLFQNKNNGSAPTDINLTNDPVVREHLHHKDTIFFRYRVSPSTIEMTGYSGPNRAPGEGWRQTDYIYSPDKSAKVIPIANGATTVVGRRWCTAGWIRNTALPPSAARTDTVQFSFEDNHEASSATGNSDFDFNDVMFKVTGIFLMAAPSQIAIQVYPSDTIRAGDTALVIGSLRDNEGKPVPFLSDSIAWSLVQNNASRPGDLVSGSPNDSITFTATAAYRRVGVIGAYGNVRDTTFITIMPGAPSQVDIVFQSPAPTGASSLLSSLDSFRVQPRLTIEFDSSQVLRYAYAALRDRYGNFVRLADAAVWRPESASIATAAPTAGKVYEGVVRRVAPVGTTLLVASQNALVPDTAVVAIQSGRIIALRLVNTQNPGVALDTVAVAVGQSMSIKVQGVLSTAPGVWVDVTGLWSMIPANSLPSTTPLPSSETGRWQFSPTAAGAAVLRVTNGKVQVDVPVLVAEAPARLTSAVTRDIDGDGLIDRIDLTFNKAVAINRSSAGGFAVACNAGGATSTFPADSIVPLSASTYALYVKEQQTSQPQTSWRPTVAVSGLPVVQDTLGLLAADGCPPVIWKVEKLVTADEGGMDTVRVYLSEMVQDQNGGRFRLSNQPQLTFNVWTKTAGDSSALDADGLLSGITAFSGSSGNDSVLSFAMPKDKGLTAANLLNIQAGTRPLRDAAGNFTAEKNRKVPVTIVGYAIRIHAGPNPSSHGTLTRQPGGTLYFEHQKDAVTWIAGDQAGTLIRLTGVPVPPPGSQGRAKGYIKIYDVIGNSVTWAQSENALDKISNRNSSSTRIDLYWNGSNKKGMLVAPGVYYVVVFLQFVDYPPSVPHPGEIKLIQKLGFRR